MDSVGALTPQDRQTVSFQLRRDAAMYHRNQPFHAHVSNGDESIPNYIATFSKALPHNNLGEVDPVAYQAYLKAIASGKGSDFAAIPMGGPGKLSNPQGAYAFTMEGPDGQLPISPPPPAFSSATMAAEMVENYWHALTRDVPFSQYDTDPLIAQAAADLSSMSSFQGPKVGGKVTSATIFRGTTPGDLTGPYLSQFLLNPITYGMTTVTQSFSTFMPGIDFLTSPAEWLSIQRGNPPNGKIVFDSTPRYIRNGRDMAAYVHSDFSYQASLNAALILAGYGASFLSDTNPYKTSTNQAGFVTFGTPTILDWVGRVSTAALKAAWCEKWLIHRRIRPEAFGGRIHNVLTGAANYPIHSDVLNSAAVGAVFSKYGNYLHPQAYPEGCPAHPSYPEGHGVLIGAGITMLKAYFQQSAVIANPVVASADGMSLVPYTGAPLTVGGELNKLASNLALGRDAAGMHYRTDAVAGIQLGEAIALGVLHDLATTCTESFAGFDVTLFDGTQVSICPGCVL